MPPSMPYSNPCGVPRRTTGNPCGHYIFSTSSSSTADATCHTTSLNVLSAGGRFRNCVVPPAHTSQFIAFFSRPTPPPAQPPTPFPPICCATVASGCCCCCLYLSPFGLLFLLHCVGSLILHSYLLAITSPQPSSPPCCTYISCLRM